MNEPHNLLKDNISCKFNTDNSDSNSGLRGFFSLNSSVSPLTLPSLTLRILVLKDTKVDRIPVITHLLYITLQHTKASE